MRDRLGFETIAVHRVRGVPRARFSGVLSQAVLMTAYYYVPWYPLSRQRGCVTWSDAWVVSVD